MLGETVWWKSQREAACVEALAWLWVLCSAGGGWGQPIAHFVGGPGPTKWQHQGSHREGVTSVEGRTQVLESMVRPARNTRHGESMSFPHKRPDSWFSGELVVQRRVGKY